MKSKNTNLEMWKGKLSEYQKSGMSRRVFCEKHGIKRSTLDYWFSRIRAIEKDQGLIEVKQKSITNGSSPLVIVIKDKYRIEIGVGFSGQLLVDAIKTLESIE